MIVDTAKIRAGALAASKLDHNESPHWYSAVGIMNEGAHYSKNAIHIANCDPATLIKLLDVVEAARILVNDAQAHPGVISVAQLAEAIQILDAK